MQQWTPDTIFMFTYLASALSGLGVVLSSNKVLTPRTIISTILVYGGMGAGLGMVGYEYLGGKDHPWRVIGCGIMVGGRAIKMQDIKSALRRMLNIPEPKSDGPSNGNG